MAVMGLPLCSAIQNQSNCELTKAQRKYFAFSLKILVVPKLSLTLKQL